MIAISYMNNIFDDITNTVKGWGQQLGVVPKPLVSPLPEQMTLDTPVKMWQAQDTLQRTERARMDPMPASPSAQIEYPQWMANAPSPKAMEALQTIRTANPSLKMADADILKFYNQYGDRLTEGLVPAKVSSSISTNPTVTPNKSQGIPMRAAVMGAQAQAPTPTPTPSPDGYVMRTPKEYIPIITAAAAKYHVPTNILSSLLAHESMGFNPNVINGSLNSPVGAQGIAQFMPTTAQGMGVDPLNVESAIDGAARLLAGHYKNFNNDWNLALAAYNAGAGNVKKYGGVPPFKETQNYIKNILNDAHTTYSGQ